MSKELLRYEDLVRIEKSLIKPVLENINRALKAIFEGKEVKLLGSDFEKNVYFYVGKDFKTAKWNISEDKVSIADVKDCELQTDSLNKAFSNTIVEAIDLIANEKLSEAEDKFGEALQWKIKEKTADKLNIFGKKPVIKEARKHLVAIGKITEQKEVESDGGSSKQVKPKPSLKQLIEGLERVMDSFLGKESTPEPESWQFSLTEGKVAKIEKPTTRTPTLMRNIEIAKSEAIKLDIKPILENTQAFISEHEELFLLKSTVLRKMIEKITAKDISITKDRLDETIETFNKMRNESESFKAIIKQVVKEDVAEAPVISPAKDEPNSELDGDKAVDSLNKEEDEEKLSFMKEFVTILTEILEKIREVGQDDGELIKRVDNALSIIKRSTEEGEWDKEELADIAKEAIELAAKVEGIEPEETEVSKRAEEEREEKETDQETISGVKGEGSPAADYPAQVSAGNYLQETDVSEDAALQQGLDFKFDFKGEFDRIEKQLENPKYKPSDRDMKIITIARKLVNGEPMSTAEIAFATGLSRLGVDKIADKALGKMRHMIQADPNQDLSPIDAPMKKGRVEEDDDTTISPEGDITFEPDDFEDIDNMETLVCSQCEKEFSVETGEVEYHCPYCQQPVDANIQEPEAGQPGIEEIPTEEPIKTEQSPAADQPGQEVSGNVNYTVNKNESMNKPIPTDRDVLNAAMALHATHNGPVKSGEVVDALAHKFSMGEDRIASMRKVKDVLAKNGWSSSLKAEVAIGNIQPQDTMMEDVEDQMKAQDKRGLILGKEKEEAITDDDFAGNEEIAAPPASGMPSTAGAAPTASTGSATTSPTMPAEESKACECGECDECMAAIKQCNEEEFERCPVDEAEVGTLPAGTDVLATYRSKSDPTRRYYIIKPKGDAPPYCTCPAWKFQHVPPSQRTCRHLDDFKGSGSGMVRETEAAKLCECGECKECAMGVESEDFERIENEEVNTNFPAGSDVLATYRSKSNPEKRYYIVKGQDGVTYCTCPSWRFQKDCPPSQRKCKHLDDFGGGKGGAVREDADNLKFNNPALHKTPVQQRKI